MRDKGSCHALHELVSFMTNGRVIHYMSPCQPRSSVCFRDLEPRQNDNSVCLQ